MKRIRRLWDSVAKLVATLPGWKAAVDVLQFGRVVGAYRAEVAVVVEVVEVECAGHAGADARGLDHRGSGGGQLVEQQPGEQERRQVVDLEGLLEAVGGLGAVAEDAAGVVGEHVDAGVGGVEVGGELADLVQAGEVGDVVVGADLPGDGTGLVRGATDDDDAMACPVELAGGRGADAVAAGAGDDDGSGLVHVFPPGAGDTE
jgi:hypothetical protein